jgi:hypothetical protein
MCLLKNIKRILNYNIGGTINIFELDMSRFTSTKNIEYWIDHVKANFQ